MDALPPSTTHYISQMPLPARAQAQLSAMDPRALGALKSQSASRDADTSAAASKSAAKQVESMFIQNMLKQFRQSSKPFESGVLNSSATESYRQMYDQQLSQDLANPGLGMSVYFEQAINPKKHLPLAGSMPGVDSPAAVERDVAAKHMPIRKIGASSRPVKTSRPSEITLVLKALRERPSQEVEAVKIAKVKSLAATPASIEDPFLPSKQQEEDLGFYEPLNDVITSISMKNKAPQN